MEVLLSRHVWRCWEEETPSQISQSFWGLIPLAAFAHNYLMFAITQSLASEHKVWPWMFKSLIFLEGEKKIKILLYAGPCWMFSRLSFFVYQSLIWVLFRGFPFLGNYSWWKHDLKGCWSHSLCWCIVLELQHPCWKSLVCWVLPIYSSWVSFSETDHTGF